MVQKTTFRPLGKLTFDTDASKEDFGAVLSQIYDDEEKVIEDFGKVLTKTERNYCATRKEVLTA